MGSLPGWTKATVDRLLTNKETSLDVYWAYPERILSDTGMHPDDWQEKVLRSNSTNLFMLCSRQSGKSQIAAALAVFTAMMIPESLTLLLSPTERQSGELFRDKVLKIYNRLGRLVPVWSETALTMTLANGSRIVSLPGAEGNIRGYSGVALLVIDEGSRVPDPLYYAVRPMLAVSKGRLVCLSTPFGKRGWFYDEWIRENSQWEKYLVLADECPRIGKQFLKEERVSLGDRWYRQEYECSFEDMVGAVFSWGDVNAAMSDDVEPLFSGAL